jgi:hypothetical protein
MVIFDGISSISSIKQPNIVNNFRKATGSKRGVKRERWRGEEEGGEGEGMKRRRRSRKEEEEDWEGEG